jgi:plastocyanin
MLFLALTTSIPFSWAISRPARAADGVRVQGQVTYDGRRPEPLLVSEAGTHRHLIEVDPETKGLKDAVVWIEGLRDSDGPSRKGPAEPAVMDQQNYFFIPHVLTVRSGETVEFRNSDLANHGVKASSLEPGNEFNVTTPPGGRATRRFTASKYPVAIGCPIHAAMAGWIYVFDHRYHTVTDEKGRFEIPAVPPGRHTLRVQHPDGGLSRRLSVVTEAGKTSRLQVDLHDTDRKPAR